MESGSFSCLFLAQSAITDGFVFSFSNGLLLTHALAVIWCFTLNSFLLSQSKETWYKKYQDSIQTAAPSTHVMDCWSMDDWFVGVGCFLLPCESPDKTWVISLRGKHLRATFLMRDIWNPLPVFWSNDGPSCAEHVPAAHFSSPS